MQYNTPALKIQGTDAFVSPFEICAIGYPMESYLQDFIFCNVVKFNWEINSRYRSKPPVQFIVGLDLATLAFSSANFKQMPKGFTIVTLTANPDEILESIYNHLSASRPSALILSGFQNIEFVSESAEGRRLDIEYMLNQFRKFQKELYPLPILITSRVHPRDAERRSFVPLIELNRKFNFELATDRDYSIAGAPLDYFKLYHLMRSAENPVNILYKDNNGLA